MIEKLTAPMTHIRAVMPKTLSYRRKRGETISQQSAMRTPSVVRDRQLPDKFSTLIAHGVLRFTSLRIIPTSATLLINDRALCFKKCGHR